MFDCAIHNAVQSVAALRPYLSAWWNDYITESGFAGPEPALYPARSPLAARPDAVQSGGALRGSDFESIRRELLDAWSVTRAILVPLYGIGVLHNDDLAAALASAVNDWQLQEWLAPEPRLRASIVVPSQNPDLAVAEIERLGADARFTQVLLPLFSEAPYGKRRFWPIYEAAQRYGLPVAIVGGGVPSSLPTPVGFPSYHIEEYASIAQVFQSQLISLVAEGVFSVHPGLKVVLIGSGCTWLPSLLWRFEKDWRGLRREVPWLSQPPSEIVRAHVRLSVNPFDAPPGAAYLQQFSEWCGSDQLLVYASAYPQWHPDSPEDVLPLDLPPALRSKILVDNARALYPRL